MIERATIAEAAAALNMPSDALAVAMTGPLRPAPDGTVAMGHVLGAAIMLQLWWAAPTEAVAIALLAADAARADGGRVMAVTFDTGTAKLAAEWHTEIEAARLQNCLLLVPADRMLAAISARVTAHRAQAARPN